MGIKELLKNISSRFSKEEIEETISKIEENKEATLNTSSSSTYSAAFEDSNGWKTIDLGIGGNFRSYYRETEIDDEKRSQLKNEYFSRNFERSDEILDNLKTILDIIVTQNGSLVGYCETDVLDKSAVLGMQTLMTNLILPKGVEDTKFIANKSSNDVAICVDPSFRNNKIGEKLLEASIKYLNHEGIETLNIEDIQTKAKGFYERIGAEFEDDKNASIDVSKAVERFGITKTIDNGKER